jgi:hypothetical protein
MGRYAISGALHRRVDLNGCSNGQAVAHSRQRLHVEKANMAYTARPFFFNERSTRLNTSDREIVSAPAKLNSVRREGLFSPLSRSPM